MARRPGKKQTRSGKYKAKPKTGSKKTTSVAVRKGSDEEGMRLNKYVAHCGVCSRRQAAEDVKEGLVEVNSEVIKEPYYQVQVGDVVKYKGKVIKPESRKVYFLMNKPKGYITTTDDEKGRRTVMDIVKNKVKERVFPVGRLDRATTGLLLLTNDGDLALKMTHPSYKIAKVYNVTLNKPLEKEHFDQIRAGFDLEDGSVKVDSLHFRKGLDLTEVAIELHVGRNRIVRRSFAHFGYEVIKLDRVYLGGLTKKDLPRGFVRPLKYEEIRMLRHFSQRK